MSELTATTDGSHTRKRSKAQRVLRIGVVVVLGLFMLGMTLQGIRIRIEAWDFTSPGRFRFDIGRNYYFGRLAADDGFLNVYEDQVRTNPNEAQKINYGPLRLAVFQAWVLTTRQTHPTADRWQEDHSFNAFINFYNTFVEWMAAVAAFLLVRHWVRRTHVSRQLTQVPQVLARPGPLVGVGRGLVAFVLLWYSPAMIISAHGWPSWNVWVVPWFLWAVLLACWERWCWSGIVLAIGALFQGQMLFVAPMFVLWPLFAGQCGRMLRWIAGFAMGWGLVISGWMLTTRPDPLLPGRLPNWTACGWILFSGIALLLVALRPAQPAEGTPRPSGRSVTVRTWMAPLAGIAAVGILAWPAFRGGMALRVQVLTLISSVAIVAITWSSPWRVKRYLLPGVLAVQLSLCMPYFGASTAWWELGYVYGTERHSNMVVGWPNNLCALLDKRFGWRNIHETVFTIPQYLFMGLPRQDHVVQIRQLLFGIYILLFVASCAAIAIQWRRNDRNFLVAAVVPWMLFYTLLPQMHDRYLLFAASAGAIWVGANAGLVLVDLVLIFLTFAQTTRCMMAANMWYVGQDQHPLFNRTWLQLFDTLHPDVSWAVLAFCGLLLWLAFCRTRPRPYSAP